MNAIRRPVHLEFLFCLSFGVFLAADDTAAAISLLCFLIFFAKWLGKMIEQKEGA